MKMKVTIVCLIIGILCQLYLVNGAEKEVAEYERSQSCNFTQECLYKYRTAKYMLGEKNREKVYFSTNVHWHCESSGLFDNQPANEYCFTLSNAKISLSIASTRVNNTMLNDHNEIADLLSDKLKGEFCYVQTREGKIVSIHYSPTKNEEAINVKRGIAAAFQANFDNQEEVEEKDPGSTHISHYSYAKTSDKVVSFTRSLKESDLLEVTGGMSKDSLVYASTEQSTFINKILYKSYGTLRIRVLFKNKQNHESSSNTIKPDFDFSDEFQANGTYVLEKIYCKQRSKRNLVFATLAQSNIKKGSITATVNMAGLHHHKIRKLRSVIPSIPEFLKMLHRNPNNTQLLSSLRKLMELEAMYGIDSQYTSTFNQLVDYYKQIKDSNKPEDVEIRKIIYSLFIVDGSMLSQKILGSAIKSKLSTDERSALLYQMVLIKNASLDLVNIVISIIPSNDNSIILVLGALARNNDLSVQKVIVDELLKRLNAVLSSNDNKAVTTLIYALGNSGSKLAISSLLSTLQYDDIDIQISVIRSLASHLDQPVVQQAIIDLLSSTEEDKILEEILKVLIDAFDNTILTNPSKELIDATINSATRIENPNLYELLVKYLERLKIDEVHVYLDLLKQQHNFGDLQYYSISDMYKNDPRVRRGSDWDENNPDFDVVASYTQRQDDVNQYPNHLAYIVGKTFDISKLTMKIGAGAFAGIYVNDTIARYKFFAKAAAQVDVFGATIRVVDIEISSHTDEKYLYGKLYLKLGNDVEKDINKKIDISPLPTIQKGINFNINELDPECFQNDNSIDKNKEIFNEERSIVVYGQSLSFFVRGDLSTGIDIYANACMSFAPPTINGSIEKLIPFELKISGGAFASFLVVQAGIEVAATFSYQVQPIIAIQGSVDLKVKITGSPFTSINATVSGDLKPSFELCGYLYHGWKVHAKISPWYQFPKINWEDLNCIKISWGEKTEWEPLAVSYDEDSPNYLLYDFCSSPIDSFLS